MYESEDSAYNCTSLDVGRIFLLKRQVYCDTIRFKGGGNSMLLSFTLKNAFSFLEESTLDMEATNIKAHGYSLLASGDKKVLPIMSIYGANASGKSNFVRCLRYMFEAITEGHSADIIPFLMRRSQLLEESKKLPELSMRFLLNGHEYTLSITSAFGRYYGESLFYRENCKGRERLIYKRLWNNATAKWSLTCGTTIEEAMIKEIKYVHGMERNNTPLLLHALCTRRQHKTFASVAKWTSGFSTTQYRSRGRADRGLLNTTEKNKHFNYLNEEKNRGEIITFVQSMNPHIINYRFEKIDHDNVRATENRYHLVLEYDSKNGDSEKLYDLLISSYESRGIYSAFTLYPAIMTALVNGGVIVIDELENSLHPLLMARIIDMFADPNVNTGQGQLVFTTHNALIMDKKYLRQDEIAFIEMDEYGGSTLYKLSDIDGVRSDLDYCKNYILGSFGAIPAF